METVLIIIVAIVLWQVTGILVLTCALPCAMAQRILKAKLAVVACTIWPLTLWIAYEKH